MTRYFLADFRTGRQILDLNVLSGPYSVSLNSPETLNVTVDMQDPDMIALNLWNSAARCKTLLGCAEGETVMALGPIWHREYDRDEKTYTLNALGVWSYFDHRYILPLVAATHPVDAFTEEAVDTGLSELSLGTIAKRWVQQAHEWTGGEIPLVLPADESADHERYVTGVEFENLGEALRKLTKVEGGPDIAFVPRFTTDQLGVEFVLRTGTDANPLLSSATIHEWDVTAPESAVSNLRVAEDGSDMASIAWATGGRSSDSVMVSRATDSTLTDAGYPLLETLDSSHSSVENQSTLDGYTAESVFFGQRGSEVWSFDAEAHAQPRIGSYWPGDFCSLTIGEYDPEKGTGDPVIPKGTYKHRIISVAGDHKGDSVSVQCAPARSL